MRQICDIWVINNIPMKCISVFSYSSPLCYHLSRSTNSPSSVFTICNFDVPPSHLISPPYHYHTFISSPSPSLCHLLSWFPSHYFLKLYSSVPHYPPSNLLLLLLISSVFPPFFPLAGVSFVWMWTCRTWTSTSAPPVAGSPGLTAVISPVWKWVCSVVVFIVIIISQQ